jgi:hypothetical protein
MPAVDSYLNYGNQGADSPARNAVAVAPSDTNDLGFVTRGLYVGGAGDVTVNMVNSGATVLFKAVPAGTLLPISTSRVLATGTTATSIVAVW